MKMSRSPKRFIACILGVSMCFCVPSCSQVADANLIGNLKRIQLSLDAKAPGEIVLAGDFLFVADSGRNVILKIHMPTGYTYVFAGRDGVAGSADGPGYNARFNHPLGLCADKDYLYVADTDNCDIRKIGIQTSDVSTIAGVPLDSGYEDGDAAKALFRWPRSLARGTVGGVNCLFVADTGNQLIRRVDLDAKVVTTFAGMVGQSGRSDGDVSDATFDDPVGLYLAENCLYVADYGSASVRCLDLPNAIVTTAMTSDSGLAGVSCLGGNVRSLVVGGNASISIYSIDQKKTVTALSWELGYPAGLALSLDGQTAYVGDLKNGGIYAIR